MNKLLVVIFVFAVAGCSAQPVGGRKAPSNDTNQVADTGSDATVDGTDGATGTFTGGDGADGTDGMSGSDCDPAGIGDTCEKLRKFCYCNTHFLCQLDGKTVQLLDSCAPGKTCDAEKGCVDCVPSCEGKNCGDDGCGGTCGTCGPGIECSAEQQCQCTPQCTGKTCGDDGCGGQCGTCPEGVECLEGKCNCTGSCIGKQCGSDGCTGTCGDCKDACGEPSDALCVEGMCQADPTCCKSCEGKQCGDDGCGGSCGTCAEGLSCVSGMCKEASSGCTSMPDQQVFQSNDPMMVMYKAFECYYLGCISEPGVCVPTCMSEKKDLALTQGCRDCYGNFVSCWVGNTSAQCAVPGQGAAGCFLFGWSEKCDSCLEANQKCKTEYEACSSLNLGPVIDKFKSASN